MPLAIWRKLVDFFPKTLALSLVYFLMARLSLQLAIPPGFAVAIFPPAGIALGAVLIKGPRMLAGVALGSFLFNLSVSWGNFSMPAAQTVFLAALVAMGCTLQTYASSRLIPYLIGKRLALDTERSIYLFFLLGGPLCCLIAASIGVTALLGLGFLPLDSYLANWATWWIGDTLGVITITPLVLVMFGEPREIWRARIRSVLIPLSVCLFLVTIAFSVIQKREEKKQYSDFSMESDRIKLDLINSLSDHYDAARNLASFFSSSPVDRHSFSTFVQNTLQTQRSITAIAWAPKVYQADRQHFEASVALEGFPNFLIQSNNNFHSITPAAEHPEYFPLTYIEPLSTQHAALGLDVNNAPARLYEIEDARDSGNITISDPLQIWSDKTQRKSVLEYIPVYASNMPTVTMLDRRAAFRGVAIVVLRMDKIFENLLNDDTKKSMQIKFYDLSSSSGGVFYDSVGQNSDSYQYQSKLNFGLRQYALIVQPTSHYWERHVSWVTWFSMFNGLFFASMLGMYLLVISAHTLNVETQVAERTSQLYDSEERLQAILSNAAEGILTTDANGFIESANESAEQLFGLARGAMFGRNLVDLFQHTDSENLLTKFLNDQDPAATVQFRQEVIGKKKNLQTVPLELAIAKTSFGNQILLVVIMHDLSERKRVDKLKGEFVSSVSHELRTPLTSIRGSLGLLAEGLGGPLPGKAQSLLTLANDNAVRLTDLINDLLDFEKLEYGGIQFNMQSHSLHTLLQNANQVNRGYATRFSVMLVFHPIERQDIFVMVDQQRFVQVLSNLLSNAIKFSKPNEQVDVYTTISNDWVRVSVRDYGIGISEKFQTHIFKKFMQEDAQSARKYAGTGLGLSLSKAMMEKMGGNIDFQSTEGKGSTFYVELKIIA